MIKLCETCGTSYEETRATILRCKICDDERQYVPVSGQAWITFDDLISRHTNAWQQHDHALFSLKTVPRFAINQRAFLLRTPQGNILWDCIANLDAATTALITALGGIDAIAISHPITTPPCRIGRPPLMHRSICMPAIASGSCAIARRFACGKAMRLSYGPRCSCCDWAVTLPGNRSTLARGRWHAAGGRHPAGDSRRGCGLFYVELPKYAAVARAGN